MRPLKLYSIKLRAKMQAATYVWENQFLLLNQALEVFGRGNVSTHVIVGLGETEKDAAQDDSEVR